MSRALVLSGLVVTLAGCHSAFVDATVSNHTAQPITQVEVDYPSASFGTERIAPNADFHYRFKVQGTAPLKLLWTDSTRKDHTVSGPEVREGAEGPYTIVIRDGGVDWLPNLKTTTR